MTKSYRRNGQQYLYISQTDSNSVSVMDVGKNTPTLVETVEVGAQPGYLTTNRSKTRLYVANRASLSVSIIDTTTAPMEVIATLPLGVEPYVIAVDPEQIRAFVSCGPMDAGSIKVVDLRATPPAVIGIAPVQGTLFRGMAVLPDCKRLFVAGGPKFATINDCLSVFDITRPTPKLIATVQGQNEGPEFLYINPKGSLAIASFRQGGINLFDAAATPPVLLNTVGAGEVNGSALSPDGRLLLMGYAEPAAGMGSYAIYDVSALPPGTGLFFSSSYAPGHMVFSADGSRVYMTSGNDLVTFDMTTHPPRVSGQVRMAGPAGGIAI